MKEIPNGLAEKPTVSLVKPQKEEADFNDSNQIHGNVCGAHVGLYRDKKRSETRRISKCAGHRGNKSDENLKNMENIYRNESLCRCIAHFLPGP